MTRSEFFNWLHTCPSVEWIITETKTTTNNYDIIQVSFAVDDNNVDDGA
jgi:hypothetical protein